MENKNNKCPKCKDGGNLMPGLDKDSVELTLCIDCHTFLIKSGEDVPFVPFPKKFIDDLEVRDPATFNKMKSMLGKMNSINKTMDMAVNEGDLESSFELFITAIDKGDGFSEEEITRLKEAYYIGGSFVFKAMTEINNEEEGRKTFENLNDQLQSFVKNKVSEKREGLKKMMREA